MGVYVLQQLVNAIAYGSILGLLAIGYTIIYGILGLINFAHGEIFMVGAFICYLSVSFLNVAWGVGAVLAILGAVFGGFLVYVLVYRPLIRRRAPVLAVFIASFGASLGLRYLFMMFLTDRRRPFPIPEFFNRFVFLGGVAVGIRDVIILAITLLIMLILTIFIKSSRLGVAMRAVAYDKETAQLMGVNVTKTIVAAFIIGSALAGLSALEYGISFGIVNPSMGFLPGLEGFIAAVVGGIGNIFGAMLGGFIIGIGEILFVAFLPASLSPLRPLFVWTLLFIILFVKPSGLFRPNIKFEELWGG